MDKIDFIGIGAEKAATSWLYTCLTEHPHILGSDEKELHYFDTVKIFGRPERTESEYDKDGLKGYLRHFPAPRPDDIRGEFTVTYMHDKRVAPILQNLFPAAKIIFVLRDPVDRAFSQYTAVKHMLPYKNFDEAISKEPEFVRHSTYAEYLSEYYARFPKEHILALRYDDIAGREVEYVQRVYRFLGVDGTFIPPSASKKERTSEEKRLVQMRSSLERSGLGKPLLAIARSLGLIPLGKRFVASAMPQEQASTATRKRLRQQFKKDIEATQALTGLDLSAWLTGTRD